MRVGGWSVGLALLVPALAHAERPAGVCVNISVDFTPTDALQIVAWLEAPNGTYLDTMYITQKTGRFGLGNRPGRPDFNTGSPLADTFPYGRREQTFPVWAHRHGVTFPRVVFQNGDENELSHPFEQSSAETNPPYCRPYMPGEDGFDSGTCASVIFSDKGTFAPQAQVSFYPPRADVTRHAGDSASVDLYRTMNPFDAVSHATPQGGVAATATWSAPLSVDYGNYVVFVEASKTYDFNPSYNPMIYPAPTGIRWENYGQPWRGQPSIIYEVPITVATTPTVATADSFVGYGDPTGETGALLPPDATITTDTPGSGAARLQLVSDGSAMYRIRVRATPEVDPTPPAAIGAPTVGNVGPSTASITFGASGDDGNVGMVAGYDVRIRAGSPITADNFDDSPKVATAVSHGADGSEQLELGGLLPETDYWIAIRPYDNCFNTGELTVLSFTTLDRQVSAVDACFIATAAYGSLMANDVQVLRRFRDSLLATTVLGELAVETYYTFGPAAAGVIGESELLRASARGVLAPIITWVHQLGF